MRDGTFGGMRIASDGGTQSTNSVSCVSAESSTQGSALARSVPFSTPSIGGTGPGSVTLSTDQEAGTYLGGSFGDPVHAGHVTQIEPKRVYEDSRWVGALTSTFDL